MPKTLRFKLEYLKVFLSRYKIWVLLSFLTLLAIFISLKPLYLYFSKAKFKTEYRGLIGLYSDNKLPPEIESKISYGLFQFDNQGHANISPLVASHQISNDERTHTFQLNKILWHNGKLLTTNDIDLDIPNVSTRIVNNQIIQIQTISPNTSLFLALSKPLIKNNKWGLGPYVLSKITYQNGYLHRIELESKSDNQPKLVYIIYPTVSEAILGYKLGEIDSLAKISQKDEIPPWTKIKISSYIDTSQYAALLINTEKIADRKHRQALAYATPKTNNKQEQVKTTLNPNSWAYNPDVKEYTYNPTKAQEFWKGAPNISLQILVNSRDLLPIAKNIQNSWQNIFKIPVEVVSRTKDSLGDYDVLLTYVNVPEDPDQYNFWHSTQTTTNLTKLDSPRIDKLLEEARQTFNQQKRRNLYLEFQKALAEESPAIFLFYPTFYNFGRIK